MANSSRGGRAPGTVVPSATADGALPVADLRSLLWRNNAVQVVSTAAWYVAAPFIPLYLASQGVTAGVIGGIIGFSGVVPLLISLHAGALVDERGPALITKGSVLLYAIAGVVLTALRAVWPVAVAYALMGIANIGFAVASQAVVAAASTPATRVRNYGYYSLWNSAGAVIGPVIGGFVTGHFGYRTAFALVWVLMIPSFAIAGSLRAVPAAPRRAVSFAMAHTLAGTILRARGVSAVLFISFMVVCGQTLQQSFYPLYLHKVGLSPSLIGMIIATISLGSMVVRSFLSRGVEWFGYGWLLLGATALLAVTLGIAPLLRQFWPLVGVSGLMGAGLGFTQPLTMSLMVESVGAEFWGVAFGMRQGVQRIGAIMSPIVFGLVTSASAVESAFFLGGATLLGAIPIMASVTGHLRRPARDLTSLRQDHAPRETTVGTRSDAAATSMVIAPTATGRNEVTGTRLKSQAAPPNNGATNE
jgi:MFS family permease